MRAGPLEGIVVVSLEQAVAAPFCTSRLADAGARVIKVERPEGDFARFYDDVTPAGSSYFVWLNRGKESVVLNLADAEAGQHLRKLLKQADVFVQNLKPGVIDRLGVPIHRLREENPGLICCSISGYGETGPMASRKAYDLLIQAESGLCSITGGADEPARVGISVVDIATGATAHAAILEALISRGKSGRGADIRVSMFDVMADWLAVPLLCSEAGKPQRRQGLSHPSIAPYGVFDSRDGDRMLVAIQSDREWRIFCALVLGDAEIANDPRFSSNIARVANRAETDQTVRTHLAMLPMSELIALLTRADIAFAQLNDMPALSRHPHLRRVTVEGEGGSISLPAPAPIFDGSAPRLGPVPSLGAHTVSVLAEADAQDGSAFV